MARVNKGENKRTREVERKGARKRTRRKMREGNVENEGGGSD